jgi:hypothetical protein
LWKRLAIGVAHCQAGTIRVKDGKDHTYWSLVETVRTPDGPRQCE